ncbi:glycosyl hydrolase family 28-related protein [Moorena sp. SIO2C4]|uniref:glycosyl hydrolase family 28-related protein n=1 Tax=Moorena sp. SIO2C4 TaxID=2607824 RepID=UPI00257F3C57|nr:glycosyl hydrolase family 28-related protein [Moorena sp. SIO2C4]
MLKTRLTKNRYRWMISKGLAVLLHKALFFIHLPRKYQSQRLKNLVGIPPHLAKLTLFSLTLCSLLLVIGLPASFSSLVSSSVAANPLYPLDANMVNVRDYGVKGDGMTDDTAAIRLAVQDNLTKHRTLLFPTGSYLVSDSMESKNQKGVFGAFLTWQGEGTEKSMSKLQEKAKGFGNPEQPT